MNEMCYGGTSRATVWRLDLLVADKTLRTCQKCIPEVFERRAPLPVGQQIASKTVRLRRTPWMPWAARRLMNRSSPRSSVAHAGPRGKIVVHRQKTPPKKKGRPIKEVDIVPTSRQHSKANEVLRAYGLHVCTTADRYEIVVNPKCFPLPPTIWRGLDTVRRNQWHCTYLTSSYSLLEERQS